MQAAGKTMRECIRIVTIRNLFQLESVVKTAERRALQWFGDIMRLGERNLGLIVVACPGRGIDTKRKTNELIILRSLEIGGGISCKRANVLPRMEESIRSG